MPDRGIVITCEQKTFQETKGKKNSVVCEKRSFFSKRLFAWKQTAHTKKKKFFVLCLLSQGYILPINELLKVFCFLLLFKIQIRIFCDSLSVWARV